MVDCTKSKSFGNQSYISGSTGGGEIKTTTAEDLHNKSEFLQMKDTSMNFEEQDRLLADRTFDFEGVK